MLYSITMTTIEEIFTKLGGAHEVARLLDQELNAIRMMMRRNVVQVKHWPHIIRAAKQKRLRGVNANLLMTIHWMESL